MATSSIQNREQRASSRLGLGASALLAIGCSWLACFDFQPNDCQVSCDPGEPGACGDGFSCVGTAPQAYCVRSGASSTCPSTVSALGSAGAESSGASGGAGAESSGASGSAGSPNGGAAAGSAKPSAGSGGSEPEGPGGSDAGSKGPIEVRDAGGPCAELDAPPREICLGAECLSLDAGLGDSLVLWLDPTTLPPAGSDVELWCDRSGHGHHARRVLDDVPMPVVVREHGSIAGDVARALALQGNWLLLPSVDALAFRERDFVIAVAAAVPSSHEQFTQLYGSQGAYSLRLRLTNTNAGELAELGLVNGGVTEQLVSLSNTLYDDAFHLYTARRARGTDLQLRVDGALQSSVAIPPELDLSDQIQVPTHGIGTASFRDQVDVSRGFISAVVVLEANAHETGNGPGGLEDAAVTALERFLCEALATCAGTSGTDAGAPALPGARRDVTEPSTPRN